MEPIDIARDRCLEWSQHLNIDVTLNLRGLGLSELPSDFPFPHYVKYLDISENNFTEIPDLLVLQPYLEYFKCSHNQLTKLPSNLHLSQIEQLDCSSNQLTELPDIFPPNLRSLDCSNNQLVTLPTIPPTLNHLYCYRNKLVELPSILPSSLLTLLCFYNKLTDLPDLPSSLLWLQFICICNNLPTYPYEGDETVEDYMQRLRFLQEEIQSRSRTQERACTIREELVSAVWAPQRIERLLESGLSLEQFFN